MRSLLAFLAMAGCFWGLQAASLQQLGALRHVESPLVVPDPRLAKATVTDYDNLAADALWLLVLQRNGEQVLVEDESRRDYRGVAEALELASDLDPRFHDASLLGSWLLADGNLAHKADALLRKGMKRFPEDWVYPYQLAFINFLYLQRYQEAGDLFLQASTLPHAPAVSRRMAAGMYARSNKRELAIETWRGIYAQSSGNIKGIAKRALARLGVQVDP